MGNPQRRAIKSGSRFEELAGYSRAIVDGDLIFVSGTVGYDFAADRMSEDVVEQTRQALHNIADALKQADASLADIVRVRVFLADRAHVRPVSGVLAGTFEEPKPANTTVICSLAEPEMKVEIEVTAVRRR